MLRSTVHAFALTLLFTGTAMAQDKAAPPPDAHLAAALDLEDAINAKANGLQMIKSLLPSMIAQERAAKPDITDETAKLFEQAVEQEFEANIDTLLQQQAEVYAKHFSESELHELAAFYRSGVGKKYIIEMPAIIREIVPLAQSWAMNIAPLAVERVRKKLAEKGLKV